MTFVYHFRDIPLQFIPEDIFFSMVEADRNGTKPKPHPLQHLAMAELLRVTRFQI